MNEHRENGIVFLSLIAWLFVIVIIMMCCSCASEKTLTEVITVHDTLREVRTDTIRDVRLVTVHDSTHHMTERIVTLKESGDTLRIIQNNTVERIIERTDSLERYRHVVDSLKAVIDKAKHQQEVKIKKGPTFLDKIIFITILIVILAGLAKFAFKTKKT